MGGWAAFHPEPPFRRRPNPAVPAAVASARKQPFVRCPRTTDSKRSAPDQDDTDDQQRDAEQAGEIDRPLRKPQPAEMVEGD